MKVFGALMVIFSGSAIGWICATILRKRVRQLGEFCQVFQWLGTEINYKTVPLREACEKIGNRLKGESAIIIKNFTSALDSAEGLSADEAWQRSIETGCDRLSLNEQDLVVLRDFGRNLGETDCNHQLKAINENLERLKLQMTEAREKAEKSERIYRYLGVAVGAIIVLFIY